MLVLASVVGVYLGGAALVAIVLAAVERHEQIPPDRLRRWRADCLAFTLGWPIALVVIPATLLLDLLARLR